MKEFNLNNKNKTDLIKIFLNEDGDYIYINPADSSMLQNFVGFLEYLEKKTAEMEKTAKEKAEKYKDREMVSESGDVDLEQLADYAKTQTEALEEICGKVNELFGQNVLQKYYKEFYEINPDFIPDLDCVSDFIQEITPAIDAAFGARSEAIKSRYNRARRRAKK